MHTFTMNTLAGVNDDNTEDIFIENEKWAVLDEQLYRKILIEIQEDNAETLLRSIKQSGQCDLDLSSIKLHFMQYDLPVLILESPETIKNEGEKKNNIPGACIDADNISFCIRIRMPSKSEGVTCIFPSILIASPPPIELKDNPTVAHEMVHLKQTIFKCDERAIRLSYWNMELQDLMRSSLNEYIQHRLKNHIEEEWEACKENLDMQGRNNAFTHAYIPAGLEQCGNILDWWLNDEKGYINISRTAKLISTSLYECLKKIGYDDTYGKHSMTPEQWRTVSEKTLRTAYKYWQDRPGPFNEKMAMALRP